MRSDMLLAVILFYSVVKVTTINATSSDCKCSPVTTELNKFNHNVLGRHIRAVVFPKNAQLLLTPAFTKAILDGRPRGLLYSMEFDMYSPLPDSIDGWRPTILVNNIKKQNTSHEPFLKPSTQTYTESLPKHMQEENPSNSYVENYDYYNFPFQDIEETGDLNLEFSNREFIRNSYIDSNKIQGFASHFHKQPYLRKYREISKYGTNMNEKLKDEMEWDHHYHDRERRQIFKQLKIVGRIFKLNMKDCIRRAICELTSNFFRSYGESVMEDIVGLILIPSYKYGSNSSRRSGDYFTANYSNVNCKKHFAVSCPYSIIDFLTKNVNVLI